MSSEPDKLDELLAAHAAWVESSGKRGSRLVLRRADLRGVDLAGVNLNWADLTEADLRGADLNSSDFLGATFVQAQLSGADLHGTYMPEADLSGADLSEGFLKKADLSGCRMVGAVLRGASLIKTDFGRSDLSGADLSRTYLLGTYLYRTVLDGVDFTEADIEGLIVDKERFDVSRVSGVVGTIGFPEDSVTIVGDGPERETTVADLIETMNRRGAQVTTWPKGQRPPQSRWRWRPDEVGVPGSSQHSQVPAASRASWVASSWAPRPQTGTAHRLDLAQHPESVVAVPQPGAKYEVSLPGGIEADYYTDAVGQARYFETTTGTAQAPNQVLEAAAAGAVYVVHPADDGRFAVVLRTDERARLVEVVADPLAPMGSFGAGRHPVLGLLGGWPGRVGAAALLESLGASAVEGLGRLGAWLADVVGRSHHVWMRLLVQYDGASDVPAGVQADWSVDGQTATESFVNN